MSPDKPTTAELQETLQVARISARKHGADSFESEEVAQNTTIKLMNIWTRKDVVNARRRDTDGWRNFVAAVARNVHRDLVRSQQRRKARELRAVGAAVEPPADRPGVQREAPRDPEGVELFLARVAVEDLIETLESERQRDCMRLVYVDGLSIGESADVLGLEVQTVRFHLRRARNLLRGQLGGSNPGDADDNNS